MLALEKSAVPPAVRRSMQGNRSRDTLPEVRLRSEMHRLGLRFRKHARLPVQGKRWTADAVFPTERVAVFLDGCAWHSCPEHAMRPRSNTAFWAAKFAANAARDRAQDEALLGLGWIGLRFWEHEDPAACAARVRDAIMERRARIEEGLRI